MSVLRTVSEHDDRQAADEVAARLVGSGIGATVDLVTVEVAAPAGPAPATDEATDPADPGRGAPAADPADRDPVADRADPVGGAPAAGTPPADPDPVAGEAVASDPDTPVPAAGEAADVPAPTGSDPVAEASTVASPSHRWAVQVLSDDVVRACELLGLEVPADDVVESAPYRPPWKIIVALWLVAMIVFPLAAFWITVQLAD